jgi:CRP/FNR family transcriptional regulator, cyclic AMP receptor protein
VHKSLGTPPTSGTLSDTEDGFSSLELFRRRGWLSEQPEPFRQQILRMARPVEFKRGQWVFAVNDPPGGIYGVISGGIGIEGVGPYTLARLGHILRSGSWFGHGPILTGGKPRSQSMRAMEDSKLLYVPLAPLRQLVDSDPVSAHCVGNMANGGSNLATRVISDLSIPETSQRIAAVILRVTAAEDDVEPDHPDGFIITQSDIGELSNVSRPNVNRVLGDFAKKGWISNRYHRIRVLDVEALSAFASSKV